MPQIKYKTRRITNVRNHYDQPYVFDEFYEGLPEATVEIPVDSIGRRDKTKYAKDVWTAMNVAADERVGTLKCWHDTAMKAARCEAPSCPKAELSDECQKRVNDFNTELIN